MVKYLGEQPPLPQGAIIAVAQLSGCVPTDDIQDLSNWPSVKAPDEERFGDYTPGRFAWYLRSVRPILKPIEAQGRQQLWETGEELERQLLGLQ